MKTAKANAVTSSVAPPPTTSSSPGPSFSSPPLGRVLDASGNPSWRSPFDGDDNEELEDDDDAPLPPSPKHGDSPEKEALQQQAEEHREEMGDLKRELAQARSLLKGFAEESKAGFNLGAFVKSPALRNGFQ